MMDRQNSIEGARVEILRVQTVCQALAVWAHLHTCQTYKIRNRDTPPPHPSPGAKCPAPSTEHVQDALGFLLLL